jgi:hypothetical protein
VNGASQGLDRSGGAVGERSRHRQRYVAADLAAQRAGQCGQIAHLIAQNERTLIEQSASHALSQRAGVHQRETIRGNRRQSPKPAS